MTASRWQELQAAVELERRGCMLSPPGEGHPDNPRSKMWGVFVGSHGGHGKTLSKAMRACLLCCGLGQWWLADFGKGPPLREVFDEIRGRFGLH